METGSSPLSRGHPSPERAAYEYVANSKSVEKRALAWMTGAAQSPVDMVQAPPQISAATQEESVGAAAAAATAGRQDLTGRPVDATAKAIQVRA